MAKRFRLNLSRKERRNLLLGLAFISPWIFGFLAFMVYPIYVSLRLSFSRYSGFGEPIWIGLENYRTLLGDGLFWQSLYNTLYYTALAVPMGVVASMIIALAMNQPVREVSIYRTILYLPSVLPIFALAFIFVWLMNPRYGLLNFILVQLGLPSINWLGDPAWAKFSIVLLAQLGAGQVALIYLAGLRAIPRDLYDAAKLDGAGVWRQFWHITLPLMTPVILYSVILGLTLGLQVFVQAYIMTEGGPNNSTLFYVYYLYQNGFQYSQMGYASAMAWVLFVISLILAMLVFRWSRRWVHYELS
ncbi:sugar ABC transporter permease [Rubrobacter taiwanensis]|uniref:Sugar ABC transporter permease n=1 Tax=Rubrobacter taiwanensis TaxID=185139 RepID=A0A4R1BI99_9ACTN|nr:sugar ABC transporter permease [Rubrobacter taiwanensis]